MTHSRRRRRLSLDSLEARITPAVGDLLHTLTPPASILDFGYALAANGQYVAVCDTRNTASGTTAGAVHLYDAVSGAFVRTLANPNPNANDGFGWSVGISGDYVVVGAPEDDTDGEEVGLAYVFSASTGNLLQTLHNPSPDPGSQLEWYGQAVAITGDLVLIGSYLDNSDGSWGGSVFKFSASTGAYLGRLVSPEPGPSDYFGISVAATDAFIAVGAALDDASGGPGSSANTGSVHLYDTTTGNFLRTIADPGPTPANLDFFGCAVGLSGNLLIAGAYNRDTGAPRSGAAYVYNATTGALIQTLNNPVPGDNDRFGEGVAIAGDTAIVGAPYDDTQATDNGAGYAFDALTGTLLDTIDNPQGGLGLFGHGVAAYGSLLYAGATFGGGGRAYIFEGRSSGPPDAVNDSLSVAEDSVENRLDVLVNDASDDPGSLTVTGVTQGTHGLVTVAADGKAVEYTPNANYFGPDSFTYTITDSNGTDTATVNLTVTAVNDNPDAKDDQITLPEGSAPTSVPVLANDTIDPDVGETLSISQVTQGAHGTVIITGGGTGLTYEPAPAYFGLDQFTYTISDGNGGTDTATVNVTVTSVNHDPVARDDMATIPADSLPTAIPVLDNDSIDPDVGETLSITQVTQGLHGTVAITGGGTGLTYKPDSGYTGADLFTYTVSDGNGGTDSATVAASIQSTFSNNPPDAADDAVTLNEDGGPQTIDVLANDSTAPDSGETLSVTTVTQGQHGAVAIAPGGLSVTYIPAANFASTDSFLYAVSDGHGGTDYAAVTVSVANDAADRLEVVTSPATLGFTEGSPPVTVDGSLRVSPNNSGIKKAVIKFTSGYVKGRDVLTLPKLPGLKAAFSSSTGTLTLNGVALAQNPEGIVRVVQYKNASPAPIAGARTISFTLSDSFGTGEPATRKIDVTEVNNRPSLIVGGPSVTFTENGRAVVVAPKVTVTDLDNQFLMGATVAITNGFAQGQDSLFATVKPGITQSFDSNNGILSLTGTAKIADYRAVLKSVKYANNSVGPLPTPRTLSFTITDGKDSSLAATRTVNVVAVNDAPMLNVSGDPALPNINTGETNPAGTTVGGLLGSAVTDPDPGALQGIAVTAITGTANGTWEFSLDGGTIWKNITLSTGKGLLLRATDMLRFVPAAGFTGTATVSYKAWDQTSGIAGQLASVGIGGGITPFSLATETATV